MFETVLFPGRHHAFTRFQWAELRAVLDGNWVSLSGRRIRCAADATVVVAITSADHHTTRRNPVPGHLRSAQAHLAGQLAGVPVVTSLVPDTPTTDQFCDYLVKQLMADPVQPHPIDPSTTVVACSTPAVAAAYARLGFEIVPLELGDLGPLADVARSLDVLHPERTPTIAARPWEIVERAAADGDWEALAHPATIEVWRRHDLARRCRELFADPLTTDDGDLTESRDYRTYQASFDRGAERNWALLAPYVEPGRIVDIGCATGAILAEAGRDHRLAESDLYGIEITRVLTDECRHRRANGYFANPNTFFHQRNIAAGPIFDPGTVDTTLTLSLTHEIWSYAGPEELDTVSRAVFAHTRPGGVWLNYDVCGPDDPDLVVDLTLRDDDGVSHDAALELPPILPGDPDVTERLDALSTRARFEVFAATFRADEDDRIDAHPNPDGSIRLRLADAAEFLTHQTYTDSWFSEMHERFTYRNLADWTAALERDGWRIDPATTTMVNPWLVEHRFAPVASIRRADDGTEVPWFATNVVVVARRPA